jgi:hypothetical protein
MGGRPAADLKQGPVLCSRQEPADDSETIAEQTFGRSVSIAIIRSKAIEVQTTSSGVRTMRVVSRLIYGSHPRRFVWLSRRVLASAYRLRRSGPVFFRGTSRVYTACRHERQHVRRPRRAPIPALYPAGTSVEGSRSGRRPCGLQLGRKQIRSTRSDTVERCDSHRRDHPSVAMMTPCALCGFPCVSTV